MQTSSKALLSPRLVVLSGGSGSGNNRRSSSWQTDHSDLGTGSQLTTPRPHSKLRPCRSLDTRYTTDSSFACAGNGTALLASDTGYGNDSCHATINEIHQPLAQPSSSHWTYDGQQQQPNEHLIRAQSARDRPQSAWKNRRHGRQPNFTFTDVDDDWNSGTAAPAGSRSDSLELHDDTGDEIRLDSMQLMQLIDDDGGGSGSDETQQMTNRLIVQERNGMTSVGCCREESVISPLPGHCGGGASISGADRRRRHSLQLHGRHSVGIGVPTIVTGSHSSVNSCNIGRLPEGRQSRAMHATDEDICDGVSDANTGLRRSSMTDCEHDAARKRALARLTGSSTGNDGSTSFRDTGDDGARLMPEGVVSQRRRLSAVAPANRSQLPRKLDPLFPT